MDMIKNSASAKLLAIVLIGIVCFIASLLVLALVEERQSRAEEAEDEIASLWSSQQVLTGPILKFISDGDTNTYVIPESIKYDIQIEPEVRQRGIFKSIVYTTKVKASGEFNASDIKTGSVVFSLPISDTRGLEKQYSLVWDSKTYPFEPGLAGIEKETSSGLHVSVPMNWNIARIPFSFELQFKGSKSLSVAPVGKETSIDMTSPWTSPKFIGNFLPSSHEISDSGFNAKWQISSFGRSYPQVWQNNEVNLYHIQNSAAGVELLSGVDAYDMTFRSVKYAILFIIITLAAFFLFDILSQVRIHPIQYFLIGSAIALFYLLLLALSEQIGFGGAYIIPTTMIAGMVTLYSRFVLKSARRATPVAALLILLYSYFYFFLQIQDYALLFGALILFVLLSVMMYTTRNIDWFSLGKKNEDLSGI